MEKEISAQRLLEIVPDSYNLEKLLPEDARLIFEKDSLDGKWRHTLKLSKETVEEAGIPLYNFYSDDENNYYYPIIVEPEDVE